MTVAQLAPLKSSLGGARSNHHRETTASIAANSADTRQPVSATLNTDLHA
jgi:hypothetical protein